MITFVKGGLLTTIQDTGRRGFQRFGMPPAGAMDQFAMQLANVLVGNSLDTEVIEATILGPSIYFGTNEIFAICGGNFAPCLDGRLIKNNCVYLAKAGSLLELPMAESGARAYVAFAGGLDIAMKMGSRSTYVKAGIGGLHGGPITDGSAIALREPRIYLPNWTQRIAPPGFGVSYSQHPIVRVTIGPQYELFSEKGKADFCAGDYVLTSDNDRMGMRFSGPSIEYTPENTGNIISDGICFGSVQVTNGQPIVMMVDRQTTGGYPKLACVISADLPLMAQLKTGDSCRFQFVDVEEAQDLKLAQQKMLRDLQRRLEATSVQKTTSRFFRVTISGEIFNVRVEDLSPY